MRKKLLATAIIGTTLLTSCSSGWSCKARYVKASKKQETLEQKKDA